MADRTRPDPPPDFSTSPLYLLAIVFSARCSQDRALERDARRRLEALGVRVTFGDERPRARRTAGKGVADAR